MDEYQAPQTPRPPAQALVFFKARTEANGAIYSPVKGKQAQENRQQLIEEYAHQAVVSMNNG